MKAGQARTGCTKLRRLCGHTHLQDEAVWEVHSDGHRTHGLCPGKRLLIPQLLGLQRGPLFCVLPRPACSRRLTSQNVLSLAQYQAGPWEHVQSGLLTFNASGQPCASECFSTAPTELLTARWNKDKASRCSKLHGSSQPCAGHAEIPDLQHMRVARWRVVLLTCHDLVVIIWSELKKLRGRLSHMTGGPASLHGSHPSVQRLRGEVQHCDSHMQ